MSLQEEIDQARSEIHTDGYAMSIGEWISIYEKEELEIHSEFQLSFRWSTHQKSRLIESVLLGIPISQVFVAQRPDGVWDVVDGLQRLCTIFEFVGILRDENGAVLPALTLDGTTYLPGLAGVRWQDDEQPDKSLTNAQRLLIKRTKIDVIIILQEGNIQAKPELFQRLNTGGSPLSQQEMRSSLLAMLNRDLFQWIKKLSADQHFLDCIGLSDRMSEEQYEVELVLRFLVFRTLPLAEIANRGDISDFLTEQAKAIARNETFARESEEQAFRQTFELLSKVLNGDSFRRFDKAGNRFLGGFSTSAFDVIALGIGYNYEQLVATPEIILSRIKAIWSTAEFTENSGAGINASRRILKLISLGRKHFVA